MQRTILSWFYIDYEQSLVSLLSVERASARENRLARGHATSGEARRLIHHTQMMLRVALWVDGSVGQQFTVARGI